MEKVNQKVAIYKMAKSRNININELSECLNVTASSFAKTLNRNNLLFNQFCKIFKYINGKDYDSGNTHFNQLRTVEGITLNQFIDVMSEDGKKVVVTIYKNTKIQIIN